MPGPSVSATGDPQPSPSGTPDAEPSPEPSVTETAEPTPSPSPTGPVTTCGGPLALGQIVVCPSISGDEKHVYTVTVTKKSDTLYTTRTRGSGTWLEGTIAAPNGDLICALYTDSGTCQLGRAGTYTITVQVPWGQGTGDYALAVESRLTPSSCTALPNSFFSFASPGQSGVLALGAAAHCFRFNQPVGTVLKMLAPSTGSGDVQGAILDAQYQPVCPVRYTTECTLTSAGPYRLFLHEYYGNEAPYTLRMPRLSNAAGCPVLRPGAFGDQGAATGSGTLPPYAPSCHRLHAAAAGPVALRFNPEQSINWSVYDDAGQRICERWAERRYCDLTTVGDYTVLLEANDPWGESIDYQVSATALYRSAGCAPVTATRWDTPTLVVRQTSSVQVNCQPFKGTAGDRVETYAAPTSYNDVMVFLIDSTGHPVCFAYSEQDGCELPATGTYRAVSYLGNWWTETGEDAYHLQVRRLSNPVGCPVVAPGAYGAAPALAGIRCRILDIPAAGRYPLKAVDAAGWTSDVQVYDPAGLKVCITWSGCDFTAPGRYTAVIRMYGNTEIVDNDHQWAYSLLTAVPAGCPQLADTASPLAVHRGAFAGVAQVDCVQLASPAGARIVEVLPGDATGAARPPVTVFDATGAYVCDSSWALRQQSCELTGTAPFYAVYAMPDGQTGGAYALAFPRVDTAPACPVLPRTAEGASVDSAADAFGFCFAVPAAEHAAREVFTYRRTAGSGDATLWVFDGTGVRYCGSLSPSIDRTVTCTLPDGPVTVLLETDAVDATYQLTHRDAATP
ncbi:hypothetical protein Cme02nite_69040 [Catellatospora methionotrophica]|uniref:Uncharacterized protein n=1 Tax=Catellatospora methionotrophica TaxID=121620 RepID=A0A8J3PIM9_9ACTN|nr:hypothetical protein Cme02nite_69040 [Catellatospora methionotrophica]